MITASGDRHKSERNYVNLVKGAECQRRETETQNMEGMGEE